MKKTLTWLIAGVVAGLVGGYLIQSCRDAPLKKENAQLKVEIAEMKVIQTELEKISKSGIEMLLEQIKSLQGNIDSLMTVNAQQEAKIAGFEQTTSELEGENRELRTEVQPVIDANPQLKAFVANLDLTIATQKKVIFTLKEQVGTWMDAYTNSEGKYQTEKKISLEYKGLWEGEKGLRQKIEIRLSLQDRRVGILGVRIKLTSTVAVVGAGVALLAILLK
jgi:SMC interacting uncharacterized protein involved in chromosome segregation